jgi:hypothetical protein
MDPELLLVLKSFEEKEEEREEEEDYLAEFWSSCPDELRYTLSSFEDDEANNEEYDNSYDISKEQYDELERELEEELMSDRWDDTDHECSGNGSVDEPICTDNYTFLPGCCRKIKNGCGSCESPLVNMTRHTSNADLTCKALSLDLKTTSVNRCEQGCKIKACGRGVDIETFKAYRQEFWGDTPSASDRRVKVQNYLAQARSNYLTLASLDSLEPSDYPGQLLFKVNDKEVCHKYFANLVGMVTDQGFRNKQWLDEVKIFLGQKERSSTHGMQSIKKEYRQAKCEHAYSYILKTVDSEVMDKSANANYDNHLYLPYHTLTSFFDEYVYLSRRMGSTDYAQRSTFFTAMEKVVKAKKRESVFIRLSGGKGIYFHVVVFFPNPNPNSVDDLLFLLCYCIYRIV